MDFENQENEPDVPEKWARVPYPEHPDRCQGIRGGNSQCWNFRQGVSQYCPAHGGNRANNIADKKAVELYQANSYLQRFKEINNNPGLVSLNQEVAVIKTLIDVKMKQITDAHSLALNEGKLADLVMKAEKLVTSCNRLNERLGNMLSTQQAMQFASEILEIVSQEVSDVAVVEKIQGRIVESLGRIEAVAKASPVTRF